MTTEQLNAAVLTPAQCEALTPDPAEHAARVLGGPVVECGECLGNGGFGDPNVGEIDEACDVCDGLGWVETEPS